MKQFTNKFFASVLCMVLIVAMALSMTACTNNNASDDANAGQEQAQTKERDQHRQRDDLAFGNVQIHLRHGNPKEYLRARYADALAGAFGENFEQQRADKRQHHHGNQQIVNGTLAKRFFHFSHAPFRIFCSNGCKVMTMRGKNWAMTVGTASNTGALIASTTTAAVSPRRR